jgi:hypothetical protein
MNTLLLLLLLLLVVLLLLDRRAQVLQYLLVYRASCEQAHKEAEEASGHLRATMRSACQTVKWRGQTDVLMMNAV